MELKRRVVVVGGCVAAKEAATAIRENDILCDITMISAENFLPYYRPMLSRAIGQNLAKSRLYLAPESWYKENNIDLILKTTVTSVNTDEKFVMTDTGDKYEYTDLVIATGVRNSIPIKDARDINGVLSIRTYDDVLELRKLMKKAKKAIVVGSGLLGLEAAWELNEKRKDVKLIEFKEHVLPNQIDNDGGEFLMHHIEDDGVEVLCDLEVKEIISDDDNNLTGIKCADGTNYDCDILIFSTGVIPNIELIEGTDIDVDRGIIVDEYMKTNIPNIFAAGDVAQNEHNLSGIWVPAMEMGKIAGANVVGKEIKYNPPYTSTMVTAFGIKVFSIGTISNDPQYETESIVDPKMRFFKKLFAKDGLVVGAILIGDITQGTRLASKLGHISLEDALDLIA